MKDKEKHPFADFVGDHEPKFSKEPWYNEHGDCVHYRSVDEAVVAERLDDWVTLYRSAVDDRVIGFQLKNIKELLNRWDFGEKDQ